MHRDTEGFIALTTFFDEPATKPAKYIRDLDLTFIFCMSHLNTFEVSSGFLVLAQI